MTESANLEADRSEIRRRQILDAAVECFRRQGFHGTSMATISKAAKMSVGHIYHYFENKEAIISAIAERDVQDLMTMFSGFNQADDILDSMKTACGDGFDRHTDIPAAILDLEIVVEATRNPKVEAIVQGSDRVIRQTVIDTMKRGLAARGRHLTDQEVAARFELIAALFEGLSIRIIRNPNLDRAALFSGFRKAFESILDS
ncbi:MAG TPA: TetR/AcrR family transcriptional regulator [Terriglobales bacterium]|nr:TetR/AcrR family transcriptional regulator [Terriglobales bacterium]